MKPETPPDFRTIFICLGLAWLVATTLFVLWPQFDLFFSSLFWDAQSHFSASKLPWVKAIHTVTPMFPRLVFGAGLVYLWMTRRRNATFLSRRAVAFIMATALLGPGLSANLMKETWGRARPVHLHEFGGTQQFTAALKPAHECAHNCSFFSGHAAVGFWLGALALAVRRWRLALALSLGGGLFIGMLRIAQGGHFLSDIVYAGLVVMSINYVLFHLMFNPGREPAMETA